MNYPKPAVIKLMEGKPVNLGEITSSPLTDLSAPAYLELTRNEVEVWTRTVSELAKLGLFTAADIDAVADYCRDCVWARSLRKRITEQGESIEITNKSGNKSRVRNQLVTTLTDVQSRIDKFRNEFGMNPVSRTRVRVDTKHEEKKAELLDFVARRA